MLQAHEIMSECIFRINESDTVGKASRIMKDNTIQHLPVFLDKKLTGMLSSQDLIGNGPDSVVSQFMTSPLINVKEFAEATLVISTLISNRIHAVPVVNNRAELVGIISTTDILKFCQKLITQ